MNEESYGALMRAHMSKRIEEPWMPLNRREQPTFLDQICKWISFIIIGCVMAEALYRAIQVFK